MVNAFQISTESKSFVVFTDTPQEKVEWMKMVRTAQLWHPRAYLIFQINTAIDKLDKGYKTLKAKKKQRDSVGMLAPVWIPDNESKSCTICAVKFTVTNRRVSSDLFIEATANVLIASLPSMRSCHLWQMFVAQERSAGPRPSTCLRWLLQASSHHRERSNPNACKASGRWY